MFSSKYVLECTINYRRLSTHRIVHEQRKEKEQVNFSHEVRYKDLVR